MEKRPRIGDWPRAADSRPDEERFAAAPLANMLTEEVRNKMRDDYAAGQPYPHCVMHPFMDDAFMKSLAAELLSLPRTYKETDLFKVNQTPDLANIDPHKQPELLEKLPCMLRLRDTLYSQRFREYIANITGSGPLNDKTDCAANVYAHSCHLLTHDDVIGTRAVSYIIYLSDRDWSAADGGALELYPVSSDDLPLPSPTATVLPSWNSFAMFNVLPGRSFHAVQEVYSDSRQRLTIQGWFHRDTPPPGAENASLQQIKHLREKVHGPWTPVPSVAASTSTSTLPLPQLDAASKDALLAAGVNPAYLEDRTIAALRKHFAAQGAAQLCKFMAPARVQQLRAAIKACDSRDKLGRGRCPRYEAGADACWELVGPPHMQRMLRLRPAEALNAAAAAAAAEPKSSDADAAVAVSELARIRDSLVNSPAFLALLAALTGEQIDAVRIAARRFRPGLDYTVATMPDDARRLDVSLTFVDDEAEEDREAWADGDIGGFECQIKAEDEENPEVVAVYDADADGEDGLLNVPASFNSLSIMRRGTDQMHFVKYVAAGAPGSRWDVAAECRLLQTLP